MELQLLLKEILSKSPPPLAKFFGTALFFIAAIISFIPVIAWWGPTFAIILFSALLAFEYLVRKEITLPLDKYQKKWLKLTAVSILFGFIVFGICKIHSNKLIHQLKLQAISEKINDK